MRFELVLCALLAKRGAVTEISAFISYSHADEWLKDELITHFAALKRNGELFIWHDRMIPAGGILNEEIDARLKECQLFLMLVSSSFLNSDYCFRKEYEQILLRYDRKEVAIVPIIIRDCDWDTGRLRSFKALPTDGVAVTRNGAIKTESHQRDQAWLDVVSGLKALIKKLKEDLTPPKLLDDYENNLFLVDFVRHPHMATFDETKIFIDPDIYNESKKSQITKFSEVTSICETEKVTIIYGNDRSGKSLISKNIQISLTNSGSPAVRITGKSIRNGDIENLLKSTVVKQLAKPNYPLSKVRVIIDDFDECTLPDSVKESIITSISNLSSGQIIVSFSNAPAVLFSESFLPDPKILKINPLKDSKLLDLVHKWKSIENSTNVIKSDRFALAAYEKLQLIFNQTELEKSPYTAVTFLELLENANGSDLMFSSFAACYDALISSRLTAAGFAWNAHDEAKNFLSLLAYRCYESDDKSSILPHVFEECLTIFSDQYLSNKNSLRRIASIFMRKDGENFSFLEEYIWYFSCARYVENHLKAQDKIKYNAFVADCTSNIFLKKYANITIYMAYFSRDNYVVESLLVILDELFSKADNWLLSDDSRELMLGIQLKDELLIRERDDLRENRVSLLNEKIGDIINNAEKVVAKYTLPFLNCSIEDSVYIDRIDADTIDSESYMKSVNALLRIHSVIGQILSSRSGTFGAEFVMDCIERMVKASGRYTSLNHAIATVIIYDKEKSIGELKSVFAGDRITTQEKFEKVVSIFSFWSVYLSHAGLARYLSGDHSVRALERLRDKNEDGSNKTSEGNVPYNFTAVHIISRLYNTGKLDKKLIDETIEKYGEHSGIMSILRVVFQIYTYYMPIEIEEKQWLSERLKLSLKKIEVQRMKAIDLNRLRPSGG